MPWWPLTTRSDGVPVPDLPPLRRIMPYVMRGRNASAVYVPLRLDIARAKKWLWSYNRVRSDEPCTLLHLALYHLRTFLDQFPEFNRFVSGRRIWQRTESTVSLVVRESLESSAPTFTIKLPLAWPHESLPDFSRRLAGAFVAARELQRRTEREARLLLRFPDVVVRSVLWCRDRLDAWNLLPLRWLQDDPLCTSVFVSNLGSIGIPEAYHHLYETGTCSVFIVLGTVRRETLTDWDGATRVTDVLPLSWTVDDRVMDGFRCAEALKWYQTLLEDPAAALGPPEAAAQGHVPVVRDRSDAAPDDVVARVP
jgi:hypothetical protein